jgi:hypothetical protein
VSLSVNPKGVAGQRFPSVTVEINEPIAGYWLKLKRSDGKAVNIKGGGPVGRTRTVDLVQPEGKFGYTGELLVNFKDGSSATTPVSFEAGFWGPLTMKLGKEDVDVARRRLTLTLSRPCERIVLQVMMDTGLAAFDGDVDCKSLVPGKAFEVSWPEVKGSTVKVAVTAYDGLGFYFGPVELFPWYFEVPHEEVNFDSGKWEVPEVEEAKLDKAHRLIADVVTRCGAFAELKLYVVGHTDSVGTKESNRSLALNRARALGAWFLHKGLRLPVFYAGFGEEAPLVATPDETDEVRNRRAQYILAIDPPTVAAPRPADWRKL